VQKPQPQPQYTVDCFLGSFCYSELLDSAALLFERESCGGGGQIVFINLTTIIQMATIHDVTGRRFVSSIYS
jgi:hypothetical protein